MLTTYKHHPTAHTGLFLVNVSRKCVNVEEKVTNLHWEVCCVQLDARQQARHVAGVPPNQRPALQGSLAVRPRVSARSWRYSPQSRLQWCRHRADTIECRERQHGDQQLVEYHDQHDQSVSNIHQQDWWQISFTIIPNTVFCYPSDTLQRLQSYSRTSYVHYFFFRNWSSVFPPSSVTTKQAATVNNSYSLCVSPKTHLLQLTCELAMLADP